GLIAAEPAIDGRRRWLCVVAMLGLLLTGFFDAAQLTFSLDFGLATLAALSLTALAIKVGRQRAAATALFGGAGPSGS
ncbi:MAG: hypothetical protein ACRD4E_12060, partial [Bryobacteraceae bacterium]